jgi:hypothetical protein
MADDTTIKTADIIELGDILKRAKRLAKAQEKAEKAKQGMSGADAIIRSDMKAFGDWLKELNIPYEPRGNTFKYLGKSRAPTTMGRIAARAMAYTDFASGTPELAAVLYADCLREQYVRDLRKAIPLEGASNGATERFLKFFLQAIPHKNDVIMFKQFIWQIKRRIHEKPTEWEIMPLFTGGQGWGKTRHLQRVWDSIPLLSAFVAKGQRFRVFDDDFGRAIFNQCYLIPFEEMSGARTTDIETLKMFITENEVMARIMRAEQFVLLRMNATFYGTSNLPGGASIFDSTGMRRFWEFKCPVIEFNEKVHSPMMPTFEEFAAIWADVDASTDASPARDFIPELTQASAQAFARNGAIHDFFEDRIRKSESPVTELSRTAVWDAFVEWRKGQTAYDREKLTKNHINDYVRKMFGADCILNRNSGTIFVGLEFKE